jgi:Fur family ferric uptake transcriptional regulator
VRTTEQRTVILEELRKCRNHPGADELYLQVRRRLPHISLGTVYRNLELLAAQGIIQRLDSGPSQKRFDPEVKRHGHFRCTGCGAVEDLPFPVRLPQPSRRHPWVRQRVITGGQAEYVGLCPSCAGSAKGPKANPQTASAV